MNQVRFINPEGVMKNPAFSQAATIEGKGKTIYIGGQNAVDANGKTVGKGDIAAQTEQIMKNIDIILKSVGASFKDIVKYTIYFKQGEDIQKAFEASQKFMPQNTTPPLVTGLFVAGLSSPDSLLEIEAIAFISDND